MSKDLVVGDVVHDTLDNASAPVKIGGLAKTSTPTAVADGDRVNAYFDEYGQPHVVIAAGSASMGATTDGGPSWTTVYTYTTSADATGTIDLTAAPTTGQKIVITDIIFSTDTAMGFSFQEETSGTVVGKVYAGANSTVQITPRSKWKLTTANKKLQGDASVAGNVAVTVFYYSEA